MTTLWALEAIAARTAAALLGRRGRQMLRRRDGDDALVVAVRTMEVREERDDERGGCWEMVGECAREEDVEHCVTGDVSVRRHKAGKRGVGMDVRFEAAYLSVISPDAQYSSALIFCRMLGASSKSSPKLTQ